MTQLVLLKVPKLTNILISDGFVKREGYVVSTDDGLCIEYKSRKFFRERVVSIPLKGSKVDAIRFPYTKEKDTVSSSSTASSSHCFDLVLPEAVYTIFPMTKEELIPLYEQLSGEKLSGSQREDLESRLGIPFNNPEVKIVEIEAAPESVPPVDRVHRNETRLLLWALIGLIVVIGSTEFYNPENLGGLRGSTTFAQRRL